MKTPAEQPSHFSALTAIVGGSVIGSLLRALISPSVQAWAALGFPLGTLFVNVTGSFAIGLCAAAVPAERPLRRLFLMTGVCGGYTTFSAFSLETLRLLQSGESVLAAANVGASLFAWLAAVWAGRAAARRLRREPGAGGAD
jgi:CrcB protein